MDPDSTAVRPDFPYLKGQMVDLIYRKIDSTH
jgi:hypothetical protein